MKNARMIMGILCIIFIATGFSTVLAETANSRTDSFGNTRTTYNLGTTQNNNSFGRGQNSYGTYGQ